MFIAIVLGWINLISLAIGLLIGEYEVAKLRHPDATWLLTPTTLDLTLSGLIATISIINLAVLFFIFLRQLDRYRRLLILTTSISIVLVIVLAWVLGTKFLPILWPTT